MAGKNLKIAIKVGKGNLLVKSQSQSILGKVSQGRVAGEEGLKIGCQSGNYGFLTSTFPGNTARILIARLKPMFGGELNAARVTSAMTEFTNAIAGGAYNPSSFTPNDLLIHFAIAEGFILRLAEVRRAIRVYNYISEINVAYGPALIASLGFDYSDISNNISEIIEEYINACKYVKKFYIPEVYQVLRKHLNFIDNIFSDDTSEKAQLIVFRMEGSYTNFASWDTSGEVFYEDYGRAPTISSSLKNYIRSIVNNIQSYQRSASYKDIAEFLYNALLFTKGSRLCNVFELEQDATNVGSFDIKYDTDVIGMLKNCDLVKVFAPGMSTSNGASDCLWEDSAEEIFHQGKIMNTVSSSKFYKGGLMYTPVCQGNPDITAVAANTVLKPKLEVNGTEDMVLSLVNFPSPEDEIRCGLTLKWTGGNRTVSFGPSTLTLPLIESCGTEVVTNISWMMTGSLNFTMDAYTINYYNTTENIVLKPNYVSGQGAGQWIQYSLAWLSQYSCAPICWMHAQDEGATEVVLGDVDNLIALPAATLEDIQRFDVYAAFHPDMKYSTKQE